jgi:catechol 2,3-dioxygenase-like lactoylglutathione lyase family enzyme
MAVQRIVTNIATEEPGRAAAFYGDLLGLRLVMDLGFIQTFAAEAASPAAPQVSFAREGGGGTAVPDLSIEVDDVDAVHRRALALGLAIAYGPVDEPWGVRRFMLRDPFGRLVNILRHGPVQDGTAREGP